MQTLDNCRDRLMETVTVGDESNLRETTSKLPPIAFEIARQTKELIQCLDRPGHRDDDDDEDDFN